MNNRVVVFTNLYPRPWEPQRAPYNRQQLERLAKQMDVEILVLVSWLDWLKAYWQKQELHKTVTTVPTRYFKYFYTPKIFRWSYGCTLLLSSLAILPRLLGKNRPRVIYAPWAYPDGLAALVLGKLLNIPVVVKILGSDINELPDIPGLTPQIAWVLKNAAAILPVSQDLQRKVIALGAKPENTQVLYDGLDPTRFKPLTRDVCRRELEVNPDIEHIVLYVGNLLQAKGCIDLFESFIPLYQQNPKTLLVYVGEGEARARIMTRATQLGLQAAVHFTGVQCHAGVAQWMGAADVVSLPSYNEGVPNVLLEAMGSGRAIVASTVGGIPEVVPEFAGILVPAGDITALSHALTAALRRTWDIARITQHISQFTWERNIAELQAVLYSKSNV